MTTTEFVPFQKIGRLSRGCTITEKIDGTNASIYIGEDGEFLTGSRTRWITPEDDNYGFARPEGVIVFHHATKTLFKKTLEKDEKPKGSNEEG